MTVLTVLKMLCAAGTIATGFISLIAPRSIKGFTGLEVTGPRGITEIRAVLGALFIGLGLAPFLFASPAVYQALGVGYAAVAVVRAVSMVLDRSIIRSNVISLAVEVVFAVLLLL